MNDPKKSEPSAIPETTSGAPTEVGQDELSDKDLKGVAGGITAGVAVRNVDPNTLDGFHSNRSGNA